MNVAQTRVFESLTYPPVARRRSLSGTVQLELEIQPTGVISRVEVVASSTHRVLDEAALDTVRGVGRVPFPPDVRPRPLRVRVARGSPSIESRCVKSPLAFSWGLCIEAAFKVRSGCVQEIFLSTSTNESAPESSRVRLSD